MDARSSAWESDGEKYNVGLQALVRINQRSAVRIRSRPLWRPMARLYSFNLTDGSIKVMTIEEAHKTGDPVVRKRIDEIILNSKNKKMVKDGFTPGWQENIQSFCGDRKQYDRALKERGLIETGKDYVPRESTVEGGYCQTDEFVQAVIDQGVELGSCEIDAIKSGEYFREHGPQEVI